MNAISFTPKMQERNKSLKYLIQFYIFLLHFTVHRRQVDVRSGADSFHTPKWLVDTIRGEFENLAFPHRLTNLLPYLLRHPLRC